MPDDRFNEYCEALLAQYTRKNTQTVTQRLVSLCGFLRQKGDVVQTMFGGSVRKGTYVTGLSDIDALLIVNQSSLMNQIPASVIESVRETIQHRLRQNTVSAGSQIPPNSGRSAFKYDDCLSCGRQQVAAGLILCPSCGAVMRNRPYVERNRRPALIKGFDSSYRRMRPERPAYTITTNSSHIGSDSRFTHRRTEC